MFFKYSIDKYPTAFIIALFIAEWCACIFFNHLQAAIFGIISLLFMSIPAAYNHHHHHNKVFRYKSLNRFLEIIMGLQTGITPLKTITSK